MSELRQGQNNLEIVGTVKKVDLKVATNKTGKEYISGRVEIEVRDGEKVNVIPVRVFSLKLKKDGTENGLFKGYKTVMDEYEVGQQVRVTGEVRLEEYYTQSGSLTSYNSFSATFFNRVEDADFKPKALATIDTYVEGMTSELDAEGLPTGNLELDAFTVGYNGRVVPLKNAIIGKDLAGVFESMYYPGTTGKITYKINNYAELEETEETVESTSGFGSTERVETNIVKNYVSGLEIIGGDLPYSDGVNEYSPADVEQAHKNRALALQELKQNSQAAATPTGFGSAQTEEKPVVVTDEDLPDF